LKKLSDLLAKQKEFLPDNISKLLLISVYWHDIVSNFLSHISTPLKLSNNKLVIGVLDNIVMQELSFKRDEIINKLAHKNIIIKDVQFKLISNSAFVNPKERQKKDVPVDLSGYENIFEYIENNEIKVSFKRAFKEYIKYLKVQNINI
jgi:hypothetical protein